MTTVQNELDWLASLGAADKSAFLAKLAHAITIAARQTYIAGSSGVEKPELLREANEVQHRVLACLINAIADKPNASFERATAEWVLSHSDDALNPLLAYARSSARNGMA